MAMLGPNNSRSLTISELLFSYFVYNYETANAIGRVHGFFMIMGNFYGKRRTKNVGI